MVAIIDYGMGNLRSVEKALEYIGAQAVITREPEVISKASHVILPGVGAFGAAMENLKHYGLVDTILAAVNQKKPFLGICLGMQLLLDSSEELGLHQGLGIIPGDVLKFTPASSADSLSDIKIPHMGWNSIRICKESPLLKNIPDLSMVYFVHSYYVLPEDDVAAAYTSHGTDFCSVIWQENIYATQFHPEKSGSVGLKMLTNFVETT